MPYLLSLLGFGGDVVSRSGRVDMEVAADRDMGIMVVRLDMTSSAAVRKAGMAGMASSSSSHHCRSSSHPMVVDTARRLESTKRLLDSSPMLAWIRRHSGASTTAARHPSSSNHSSSSSHSSMAAIRDTRASRLLPPNRLLRLLQRVLATSRRRKAGNGPTNRLPITMHSMRRRIPNTLSMRSTTGSWLRRILMASCPRAVRLVDSSLPSEQDCKGKK
ncbi:hypothetical protein GQ54DRAFT_15428 [Martensiomyces pterosporus]|nr:hypothetical protein GQ54DRAFT_15428 [Martensiomyces pterosporus]